MNPDAEREFRRKIRALPMRCKTLEGAAPSLTTTNGYGSMSAVDNKFDERKMLHLWNCGAECTAAPDG
jgi:hypothetical protein